jgi:hypothetical protein
MACSSNGVDANTAIFALTLLEKTPLEWKLW